MKVILTEHFKKDLERLFSKRYAPLRFMNNVLRFPDKLQHYWQRITKGYSYEDVWSIDYFIDSWLPEAIRDLKRVSNGVPGPLTIDKDGKDVPMDIAVKNWNQVLDDVADGFEAHRKLDYMDYNLDNKQERKELERKFNKGIKLFAKYYGCFWW